MRRREFIRFALAGAVGTVAAPALVKAQTNETKVPKRVVAGDSCGIIIDLQESFLGQLDGIDRSRITRYAQHFARLLVYFKIPVVVTLEKPAEQKGSLPQEVKEQLGSLAETFEKNFFDLSRETQIRDHLADLKKKQVIVAGCETDVCVLESCLGLLKLGYEVFVVQNLVFSSARNVDVAIARMKAEGVTFLTYKSLFYALVESVDNQKTLETSATVTRELPQ
ncbi:MAG: isochorismatase family protein [Xanthobacteraceae bacterium]